MAGPKLEARKSSDLAYIEHQGPYDKVPWEEYMHRLYGWAKEGVGIKIKKLPAMKVASISHKGPGSEYANTYSKLMEFVGKNGYEVLGPPMEIYSKKPEVVGGETILYAKVMMPVKKK